MTVREIITITDKEQTLTNKTINATNNTIQNLDVDNFKKQSAAQAGKVLGVTSTGDIGLLEGTGGNYLPLSGGNMTGDINMDYNNSSIKFVDRIYMGVNSTNDAIIDNPCSDGSIFWIGNSSNQAKSSLILCGCCPGTTKTYGSYLVLSGKNNANAGEFRLAAANGSTWPELHGYPNGLLTWYETKVMTNDRESMGIDVNTDIVKSSSIQVYLNSGFLCINVNELYLNDGQGEWALICTIPCYGKISGFTRNQNFALIAKSGDDYACGELIYLSDSDEIEFRLSTPASKDQNYQGQCTVPIKYKTS